MKCELNFDGEFVEEEIRRAVEQVFRKKQMEIREKLSKIDLEEIAREEIRKRLEDFSLITLSKTYEETKRDE